MSDQNVQAKDIAGPRPGTYNSETGMEYCVLCRSETNIHYQIHVEYRLHYVEGCGQLCKNCYKTYADV
jgi:hypothetical protein